MNRRAKEGEAGGVDGAASAPFKYNHLASMAYLGNWTALVDASEAGSTSGRAAWLLWRSAYFTQTVSMKNKILIPMYWFLTWIFGRDVTRI